MSETVKRPIYHLDISEWCYAIGGWLALVPEAILLLTFLGFYHAFGNIQFALLTSVIILLFIVRITALYLAQIAYTHNRPHDAQILLQIALALYPWSADALALRGLIALTLNDASSAKSDLAQAIRLLPTQSNFYIAYSTALLSLYQLGAASEAARQALAINPANAQAFLCLAEAEQANGRVEEYLRAGLDLAHTAELKATFHCAIAGHLLSVRRLAEASLALRKAESLIDQCPSSQRVALQAIVCELQVSQN